MASNLTWALRIDGLDQNIIKLEKLERLLNSVGRKIGSTGLGGSGGINGAGGNTTIVGGVPGAGGGSSAAGAAEGAALGSLLNRSTSQFSATAISGGKLFKKAIKDVQTAEKELFKAFHIREHLERRQPDSGEMPGFGERFLSPALEYARRDEARKRKAYEDAQIEKEYQLSHAHVTANEANAAAFQRSKNPYSGAVPPLISGWDKIKNAFKEAYPTKETGLGGALRQLGGGAAGGGIGGIGGKLAGMAGAAMGFPALGAIIAAVTVAFIGLKAAVHQLIEGIKNGAEAYQRAAKFGRADVGRQSAIDYAFKAIGMESPDLSLLQGQFNRSATRRSPGGDESDVILGAARAGQFGNMQQLDNMAKEFKDAMHDAKNNAQQLGNVAKAMQVTSMAGSAIAREWHTMWAQTAAIISPLLNEWAMELELALEAVNVLLEFTVTLMQLLHLIPSGQTNFKQSMGASIAPSFSSWEKMGLNFKGGSNTSTEYLREIANNTKIMVQKWTKVEVPVDYLQHAQAMNLP